MNEDIISRVRFITGYPEMVFSDEKVEESIEFTKDEVRSKVEDPTLNFDELDDEQKYYAKQTLIWGTCYHLKISTGEIGGFPMSVGDVSFELLRQRGENDPDLFSWGEKFLENLYRMDGAPLGFGRINPERENREYSLPEVSDYGE